MPSESSGLCERCGLTKAGIVLRRFGAHALQVCRDCRELGFIAIRVLIDRYRAVLV